MPGRGQRNGALAWRNWYLRTVVVLRMLFATLFTRPVSAKLANKRRRAAACACAGVVDAAVVTVSGFVAGGVHRGPAS